MDMDAEAQFLLVDIDNLGQRITAAALTPREFNHDDVIGLITDVATSLAQTTKVLSRLLSHLADTGTS